MTIQYVSKDVFENNKPPCFEILSCNIKVVADCKSAVGTHSVVFELKKIREGDNLWDEIFGIDDKEPVLKSVLSSQGTSLEANPSRYNNRVKYTIRFPNNIAIQEPFSFTINYDRELILVKGPGSNFLARNYHIIFNRSFDNQCTKLFMHVKFKNSRARLISCCPLNEHIKNTEFKKTWHNLSPHEIASCTLWVTEGIVGYKVAAWITNIGWLFAGALIGEFVHLFFDSFK